MTTPRDPSRPPSIASRLSSLALGLAGTVLTLAAWTSNGPDPSFPLFLLLVVSALGGLLPLRAPGLQPLPLSLPVVGSLAVSAGAPEAMAAGFLAGLATAAAPDRGVAWLAAWGLAGILALAAGLVSNGFSSFDLGGPWPASPGALSPERIGEVAAVLTAAFLIAWLAGRASRTRRASSWTGGAAALGSSAGMAAASLALAAACDRFGAAQAGAVLLSAGLASALWGWRAARLERLALRERQRAVTGLSLVEAIALAIEAKDRTSERHLRRVRAYARGVGRRLGMAPAELEELEYAALLHDIGKLVVPESILSKPAALSSEEFRLMSTHAAVGAEILQTAPLPSGVPAMVRHHHERYDGTGYPDGLVGMEIPLGARILAAVDTFDALTSERPHRRGVPAREAIAYLQRNAGTQFDARVVGALVDGHAAYEEALRAEERARAVDGSAAEGPADGVQTRRIHLPFQAVLDHIATAHMEVYSLYEIGQALGKTLNLEETFALLGGRMQRLVHFSACVIYVYDQEKEVLRARHAAGAGADRLRELTIPLGQRLSGWVAQQIRPAAARYPASPLEKGAGRSDIDEIEDAPELARLKCSLAVPLVLEDALIGVLALYDTEEHPYTPQEEGMLSLIAHHVASALRSGLLWEQTQQHTLSDALTGLPNERFMFIAFDQESARARHSAEPLALMVVDVDNFRGINEAYGHQAGDRFLMGMAEAIRSQLRASDTCIRYAADEFVAILPGLDAGQAQGVARRLVEAAQRSCLGAYAGRVAALAVSVGCAVMPRDGEDFETLMSRATERMRAQKADHGAGAGTHRAAMAGAADGLPDGR